MKKIFPILLYIVTLLSAIFLSIRIVMTYDLRSPLLFFYVITTGILGYWFLKMGIVIIRKYRKK